MIGAMQTIIYLIRHGETDWNLSGRWQGHADIPLNDAGRQQADLLARRLADEGFRPTAIYSSDLSRAYATAHAAGLALGVPVQLYPMLREMDLGAWSGLTREEVAEQYPVEWALLRGGQDIPRGIHGESRAMVRKRARDGIGALADQHAGGTLALFSHGALIAELLRSAATPAQWRQWEHDRIGNSAISIFAIDGPDWSVVSFNDTAHLHQLVPPEEPQPDDVRRPTEGEA
jgi:broad specificity phosphatase PhoE